MENAVNALLIVAGALIGIMILSLGVSLYSSLRGYVEESQQEIINRELQQFNEQFFKYINCEDSSDKTNFTLTMQDVVTAANLANDNNLEYGLENQTDTNYYVTINIESGPTNLEKYDVFQLSKMLEKELEEQQVSFRCRREDVIVNQETGRVCEVTFSRIK